MTQAPVQREAGIAELIARRSGQIAAALRDMPSRYTDEGVDLAPQTSMFHQDGVPMIRTKFFDAPAITDFRNFERPQTFGSLIESSFRDLHSFSQAARIGKRLGMGNAPEPQWLAMRDQIASNLPSSLAAEGLNEYEIERVLSVVAESNNFGKFLALVEDELNDAWDDQQFHQAGIVETIAATIPAVITDPTLYVAGIGAEKAAVQLGARGVTRYVAGGLGMSSATEAARAARDLTSPITDEVPLAEHLTNIASGAVLDGLLYAGGKAASRGLKRAMGRNAQTPLDGAERAANVESIVRDSEQGAPPFEKIQESVAESREQQKVVDDSIQEYVASGQTRQRQLDFTVEDSSRFEGAMGFDTLDTAAKAMGVEAKPPAPKPVRLTNEDFAQRFVTMAKAEKNAGKRIALNKAAKAIREYGTEIFDLTDEELLKIPGIGVGSVKRIREILEEINGNQIEGVLQEVRQGGQQAQEGVVETAVKESGIRFNKAESQRRVEDVARFDMPMSALNTVNEILDAHNERIDVPGFEDGLAISEDALEGLTSKERAQARKQLRISDEGEDQRRLIGDDLYNRAVKEAIAGAVGRPGLFAEQIIDNAELLNPDDVLSAMYYLGSQVDEADIKVGRKKGERKILPRDVIDPKRLREGDTFTVFDSEVEVVKIEGEGDVLWLEFQEPRTMHLPVEELQNDILADVGSFARQTDDLVPVQGEVKHRAGSEALPEGEIIASAGSPEPRDRVTARGADGKTVEFAREGDDIVYRSGDEELRMTIDEVDRAPRVVAEGEPMTFRVRDPDGNPMTIEFSADRSRVSVKMPDTSRIVGGEPVRPAAGGKVPTGGGDEGGGGGNIFGDGAEPPDDFGIPITIENFSNLLAGLNKYDSVPTNLLPADTLPKSNVMADTIKAVQNYTTSSRWLREGALEDSELESIRLLKMFLHHPTRGTPSGVFSGKIAGITPLESMARRFYPLVDRVHEVTMREAALMAHPSLDKAMSGRAFEFTSETLDVLRRGGKTNKALRAVSDVSEIIRLFSDSIDNAQFSTVFDTLDDHLRNHIQFLVKEVGTTMDRMGRAVDNVLGARRMKSRSSLDTFMVRSFDEIFLVRMGENARLQHYADMKWAIRGNDGPAPDILTDEGAKLLRSHGWAQAVIPEDFRTRQDEWAEFETAMRAHFNKNLLGNVGREAARRVAGIMDENGRPVLRQHGDDAIDRTARIFLKTGFLHTMRLFEETLSRNGRGIQRVEPSAVVADISLANYNTDLDNRIGNEIRERINLWVDYANREAGAATRHSGQIQRDIHNARQMLENIAGYGGHLTAGQQAFAEGVRDFGRMMLLGQLATSIPADLAAFTGKLLSQDLTHAMPYLINTFRGMGQRLKRMNPDELAEAAPTMRAMYHIQSIHAGRNARALTETGSPFSQYIDDSLRESLFGAQARTDRGLWLRSGLSSVTRSFANIATAGSAFLDGRLRNGVFEQLRVASLEVIVKLSKALDAGETPAQAIKSAGLQSDMVASLSQKFTRDELRVLKELVEKSELFVKAKDGTYLPIGMAVHSVDPDVQAAAAAVASRFTGDRVDVPSSEIIQKFVTTSDQERVLYKYADWLDTSIADNMVMTRPGDAWVSSVRHSVFGKLTTWLLSFQESFSSLWLKQTRNNPRAGAGYVGGMIGGAILVRFIRAWMRDGNAGIDQEIERMQNDPVGWWTHVVTWGGVTGSIGERVTQLFVSIGDEEGRNRLRRGQQGRATSLPILSAADRIQQAAATFWQALASKDGVTEAEFRRAWGNANILEGSMWQLPFKALGPGGVGLFDSEHPLREAVIENRSIGPRGFGVPLRIRRGGRRQSMSNKEKARIINSR